MQNTEMLYWGLKFSEWLTLAGIVLGPIIAVAITLIYESRRRKREGKNNIFKLLLNTRHMPSDGLYCVAINSIPAEFSTNKKVMEAWEAYLNEVRYKPTPENQETHDKTMKSKQSKLIYEVGRALGYKLAESDIDLSAYISSGFVFRDTTYLDSLIATKNMAICVARITAIMDGQTQNSPKYFAYP